MDSPWILGFDVLLGQELGFDGPRLRSKYAAFVNGCPLSHRRRHRHRGGRSLGRSSFLLLHFPLSRKSEKSFGNDGGSSASTRGEAVWTLVFRRH